MTDRSHPHDDLVHAVAPETENLLTAFFGELLSVYTRQQATEDGVLVDLTAWASSGPEGMFDGFTVPVAVTRALWAVIDLRDTDWP